MLYLCVASIARGKPTASYGVQHHSWRVFHSCTIVWSCAGIGFETARALASGGYATVLACRNLDKAKQACEKIR